VTAAAWRCSIGLATSIPFVVLALPYRSAYADKGEIAVGGGVTGGYPKAIGGELGGRLGIGDSLALDLRSGGGGGSRGFGYGEVGVVALFDVLAWVPEARIAAGAEMDRDGLSPIVQTTLGLRRYLTADLSIAFEGGAAWTPGEWRGTAALGLWLAFL
jgi:hypothetical protein